MQINEKERRKISSSLSFLHKFITPGIVGVLICTASLNIIKTGSQGNVDLSLIVVLVGLFLYLLRYNVPLKKVEIDKDYLYISNYSQEAQIKLSNIKKVVQTVRLTNVIWIFFEVDTDFGQRICFKPHWAVNAEFDPYPTVRLIANMANLEERPEDNKALRKVTVST